MQNTTPPPSFEPSFYTSPLSPGALRRQLSVWNQTEAAYPQHCLHELFEAQVQRTPNAIAVLSQDQALSYEQINTEANQVARYVRRVLGMDATGRSGTAMGAVEVEPRVALFVSHTSPLALVGFWGILKAGCAVVLMDTAASKDRIASILAEAQPQIILVQAQLLARLPQHEARVICLDAEGEALAREGSENQGRGNCPSRTEQPACGSGTCIWCRV